MVATPQRRPSGWWRSPKPMVFGLCLVPLALLMLDGFQGRLGANPVETITHVTGLWGLRLLLLTLGVTPLRRLFGWNRLIAYRRMLGLFAFFYGSLHLATYLVFDQFFDLRAIWDDVIERPYITLGFSAFLLLVPLAVTSTNGWIRRLGKRWVTLHKLIYPAAILVVAHFLWLVKADYREPGIYALILALLLGYRLLPARRGNRRRSRAGQPKGAVGRVAR